MRKVASDLDIHLNLVNQWRRMYMTEGEGGNGEFKARGAELMRLEKELDEVKEDRDI